MSDRNWTYYRYTNVGNANSHLQNKLNTIFGVRSDGQGHYIPEENHEFSLAVNNIIINEFKNLYALGYMPWICEHLADGENEGSLHWYDDDDIMYSWIIRRIMQKYKYFDYYRNKWSLVKNDALNTKTNEVYDGSTTKVSDTTDNNVKTRLHNSNTDMSYKSDVSNVQNGSSESKSASEESPLGTSVDSNITTPSLKTDGKQDVNNRLTTDRDDKNITNVESRDDDKEASFRNYNDNVDDSHTKDTSFTDAIEAIKLIKYQDYTIVDLLTDIVDSTCKELNELI